MLFRVKAYDSAQGVLVYALEAQDEADASRQVHEQGRKLISLTRSAAPWKRRRQQRIPLVQFSEELISLLNAGLSLIEAIDALVEKESQAGVRGTLEQLRSRLYEGTTLSTAMAELPTSFPPLYVATVRASERTGAIREALARYVTYQRQIDVLRKKLISASIYPAVLCGAGLLVTFFLLGYVVPRFAGIYEDLGGNLPLASRLLLQWGKLLGSHGTVVLAAAAALLLTSAYALTRPVTRAALLEGLTRIPNVGRQLHTYRLARMYRTVGMLLRGGVPAVTALKMSAGVLDAGLRPGFSKATLTISQGQSMANAMEQHGLTTPVAVRMLRVGERSGNMGDMMERIAAFYEELARAVDLLTRLIEPLLMTVIGLIIGLIVVLMYFPIFELAGSLQ